MNHWISNCDTKSSFILTFFGVILTIIFTSNVGNSMTDMFSLQRADSINGESFRNFVSLLLTLAFFGFSVITFYHIYLTLKGRIDPTIYEQQGLNCKSNIFFGSVVQKKFIDFETESNLEDSSRYLNDLNSQVFITASIANEKFKHYNKSLLWMFLSLLVFIVFVVIK